MKNYQSLLGETSMRMVDVAYTLANRREHLAHRSYAVATNDKLDIAGPVSSQQGSQAEPSLIMVFTGQGTAWPRVGRELLRSYSTFSRTIK